MLTVYSDRHRLHHGHAELIDGEMKPCFEMPSRADFILERVRETKLGDVIAPASFGLDPVHRVHDKGFIAFLGSAWDEWSALGRKHDALPLIWPVRGMRQDRVPEDIDGKLGYYSMDAGVPITEGTWAAVSDAVNVALTGARHVREGARGAFSLCRPPGHHAAADYMGGYCYINNAAVAAQSFLDAGAKRVAILDVDYHHGNGTQSIFYRRSDVLFASLHGDPRTEYPFFLGHADEAGAGAGLGYNANFPLQPGTAWADYTVALDAACARVADYAPDALVVSLGVDTFEEDPISQFKLRSADYLRIGEAIGRLGKPTLFVMEGGYAVAAIGVNAVNVLVGFESV